jgi:hypothetical protein
MGIPRRRTFKVDEIPAPPPGQSPTLAAWHVDPGVVQRDRWPGLIILLGWFGIVALLRESDGFEWIMFLGGALLVWWVVLRARRREGVWVGKDWLCVPLAWGYKWVRTDRLQKLKLDWHDEFIMRDRDGRRVSVEAETLRRDPELRRILRAAVQRSVEDGLRPNLRAREELGLNRID